MWFDSHCHLNLPGFDSSVNEVWQNARQAGICRAFVPGTNPEEWSSSTVPQLPGVCTGVGLHPFTLERWSKAGGSIDHSPMLDAALRVLQRRAECGEHVAIGECGWDKPLARREPFWSLARQTAVVEKHLRLAADANLPVVLHVVHAHGLALQTLAKHRLPRGGIIHCFSGSAELVPLYGRLGFKLGYGTQLTRPNAIKAISALRATPRELLVLETDAPYTKQITMTQLPNSPLALLHVANVVSTITGISLEHLAQLTFENAAQIFGVPDSTKFWT